MGFSARIGEFFLFMCSAGLAILGFASFDSAVIGYEPSPRNKVELRVVTWNIGGPDGRRAGDDDLSDVAASIIELDPDLAFFQELRDRAQFDVLLDFLGGTWRGAITTRGDRRIAVAYSRGRVRASVVSTASDRPAMSIVYRSPSRRTIAAVVLHADAFSSRKRNRQIGIAVDALHAASDLDGRILVGDINIDLDLDKRRDLFSDDEHLDVESYNYITIGLFDAGIGRGSTAEPDRRLDYIFIDANLAVIRSGPWKDRRTGEMDHDPMVADLEFITGNASLLDR